MRNEECGIRNAGLGGLWDRCPSVPVEILNEGEEVKIQLRIRFGTAGPGLICPGTKRFKRVRNIHLIPIYMIYSV